MNLLVLSDLHLSSQTAERCQSFLNFLEDGLAGNEEVLIVGDLFDLWFGWRNLTFSYQQPILQRMEVLASKGLALEYVEGNRDFGIQRYKGNIFREVWGHSMLKEWGGRIIHVEHGDLINRDDKPYRLWRRVSKNPLSFFLFDHLPAWLLLRFATALESRMKGTNLKYKTRYPEEYCKRFYLEQFDKGVDVVVVGHFHEEREVQIQAGNKNVLFYNLPSWEQGFRYLVIPEGNGKPYFKEAGR